MFGTLPHTGRVTLDGKTPNLMSERTALAAGIGLMARDRAEESIAPSLSIRENAFLNPGACGRGMFQPMSPRAESELARALGASVGLQPNDPALAIEGLSGGNQQKVVVGRWLATGRRLLIAEDPTAGVDVGAKAEIYTGSSVARWRPASRSLSSPPISRRSRISATARWSSTAGASSRNSRATA